MWQFKVSRRSAEGPRRSRAEEKTATKHKGRVALSQRAVLISVDVYAAPIEKAYATSDWCQNRRPWMTLNGQYALYCRKDASFGAHHKNLNEDRPIPSAAEM